MRPDISDTAETALLPELATDLFYQQMIPVTRSFFSRSSQTSLCRKAPSLPCRILQNLHHHNRMLHHFPAGTPVLSVKLTCKFRHFSCQCPRCRILCQKTLLAIHSDLCPCRRAYRSLNSNPALCSLDKRPMVWKILGPLQIPRKFPYFKTAVPEVSTPLNPRFA